MRAKFISFSIFLFLAFLYSSSKGDTLITKDGDYYYGKVVSKNSDKVIFEINIGTIKFNRDEISSITIDPATAPKEEDLQSLSENRSNYEEYKKEEAERKVLQNRIEVYRQYQDKIEADKKLKQEEETLNQPEISENQNIINKRPTFIQNNKPVKKTPPQTKKKKKEKDKSNNDVEIKPTIRGSNPSRYKTF